MGGNLTDLLRRGDVRKELELLDDQVQQLTQLDERMRDRMREAFGRFRAPGPEGDRGQRRPDGGGGMPDFRGISEQLNKQIRDELSQILLPHQLTRLDQLATQMRMRGGTGALFNPETAQQLGITDQQRDQLRAKVEAVEQESRRKTAEIRRQAQEEVISLLTSEQQAKYREMVGPPFEFENQPPPQGPPGGGGPREPQRKN